MTPLPQALAAGRILALPARVRHTRLRDHAHAFSYWVDYLLFAPEHVRNGNGLLAHNRFGIFALHDSDHGGSKGEGAAWVWEQLGRHGISRSPDMVLGLLTQPRFLGFGFNPVSFWLLWRGDDLIASLVEVNNTWRQRHSYLCLPSGEAISASEMIEHQKVFHVSPFQDITGSYRFRFAIDEAGLDILIHHKGAATGLVARMKGAFRPLRQRDLAKSILARPGGALRVVALIYAHALRLKWRGIAWRALPPPPSKEMSQ